jgi:hypothetical protein
MSKCDSGSNAARELFPTTVARRNYPTTIARLSYASSVARRAYRPDGTLNVRGKKAKPQKFDGGIY